ncbi:hypothetical protein GF406_20455 [candidate division KSB1 bacterium]|nr:hypothetical protein [candidate division KSB1 bacterium]
MIKSLYILLICASVGLSASENQLFSQLLQTELEQKQISLAQALTIELLALRDPDQLPDRYDHLANKNEIRRNATLLRQQVLRHWSTFSRGEKSRLTPLMSRPSKTRLPESLVTDSGLFKIHFTLSGSDATTMEFVRATAAALDSVYDYQIKVLKYDAPPQDYNQHGPEYDLYILNYAEYGGTTPETPVFETDRPYDYTSWIEIDNDFSHTPTKGLAAMRVTVAHEFFHMVQMGYRAIHTTALDATFLYESSATWMEDVIYENVNDYVYYLYELFTYPSMPFYRSNGLREYANSLYWHMIEKKHGKDLVRSFWQALSEESVFQALDNALAVSNSTLQQSLVQYAIWLIFTGDRAYPDKYFPEGEMYPEITPDNSYEFSEDITWQAGNYQGVSRYFLLRPELNGPYILEPDFERYNGQYLIFVPLVDKDAAPVVIGGNSKETVQVQGDFMVITLNTILPETNFSQDVIPYTITFTPGQLPHSDDEPLFVYPNPYVPAHHDMITVRFELSTETNNVRVLILDQNHRIVLQESLNWCSRGYNTYRWNGTNMHNDPVASGHYFIWIQADQGFEPAKIAIIR